MTRQEAIEQLKNITSVPSMFIDETIKELVEVLKKPMTLEEFLGWEEGVEYKANCELYKIENDTLKIRYGKRWVDDYELHLNNYDSLIGAKKVEPRYLLQTDLTSENGIQYLSFDKKRREYFMGALMTSENVQQKFTDSEILKIESITRFAKLCEKVEVE